MARTKQAACDRLRFSKSFACLRQRPSHPKERSTIQRFGKILAGRSSGNCALAASRQDIKDRIERAALGGRVATAAMRRGRMWLDH